MAGDSGTDEGAPVAALLPPGLGVSKNACRLPLSAPLPTICPASLMCAAPSRTHPLFAGMRVLRSIITPFCQRKAREAKLVVTDDPPTSPRLLMLLRHL